MKKRLIALFVLICTVGTAFAQRIVYVDTEYILSKVDAYDEAQAELEATIENWQNEIAEKEANLLQLQTSFEEKKPLMPENLKLKEQQKLEQVQTEIINLKQKRFGRKGDLFQQQQNLIKPIQDEIYNAIKKMAEQRDYDFVLDKATGVSILFVKPKFDMSDEVLRIMNRTTNN